MVPTKERTFMPSRLRVGRRGAGGQALVRVEKGLCCCIRVVCDLRDEGPGELYEHARLKRQIGRLL